MPDDSEAADRMVESLLLAATRVLTFEQQRPLTNASGFFFERDGRLFLVASEHVLFDEPSKHFPDRIETELHIEAANMARSIGCSIPLYRGASRNARHFGQSLKL